MKQAYRLLSFAFLMSLILSCGGKHDAQEDDVEWKQMDEFHAIMADVYHPLKDSGNLEPIKKDAPQLAAAATKWAQSKLPAKVDNEETRVLLAQLEDGCQELSKTIREKSDEDISAKLTALHETFHSIMEKWHSAGKEEGAEEHHQH